MTRHICSSLVSSDFSNGRVWLAGLDGNNGSNGRVQAGALEDLTLATGRISGGADGNVLYSSRSLWAANGRSGVLGVRGGEDDVV
mmetsp:Transcript_6856/g.19402  ORF Transcript_6856/g.19402 Transcript_6856/m.19402 type:complete len:85 (-) Transcript_6856:7-261(-)